jgi:lysophospholipase L1-like esterase
MAAVILSSLLQLVGCSGKTPIQPPPPPPPDQLRLSCPLGGTVEATRPDGTDVNYDMPSSTGGRSPIQVECTPGSGSGFPIGETKVGCTAIDGESTRATCEFVIRVRVSQTLSRARFVAFGDSITDGVISLVPFRTLDVTLAYPYKLEQLLSERYPTQTFTVVNEGKPGEKTTEGDSRLPSVLDAHKPEVMLLLEGVNAVRILSTSSQAAALRRMITIAQSRNVEVLIATVMPISPAYENDHRGTMSRIMALNERIFRLADELGLGNVVDLFGLFQSNMQLLGSDGLHPTAEGQTRIAEAFMDEIVRRYETRVTMTYPSSKLGQDVGGQTAMGRFRSDPASPSGDAVDRRLRSPYYLLGQ